MLRARGHARQRSRIFLRARVQTARAPLQPGLQERQHYLQVVKLPADRRAAQRTQAPHARRRPTHSSTSSMRACDLCAKWFSRRAVSAVNAFTLRASTRVYQSARIAVLSTQHAPAPPSAAASPTSWSQSTKALGKDAHTLVTHTLRDGGQALHTLSPNVLSHSDQTGEQGLVFGSKFRAQKIFTRGRMNRIDDSYARAAPVPQCAARAPSALSAPMCRRILSHRLSLTVDRGQIRTRY